MTRDIDIAVNRFGLERIGSAARDFFQYRHEAGSDRLLDRSKPVRPVDSVILKGCCLMPVDQLIRMKLTSFRLNRRVHIQNMDEPGLITPDIEALLQPVLRERLAQVRATE